MAVQEEKRRVIEDVALAHDLDRERAERLVEIATHEASVEGSGQTVLEREGMTGTDASEFASTETRINAGLISRRWFWKGAAALGIASAVGDNGVDFVWDWARDTYFSEKVYFSGAFIRAYIRNRQYSQLMDNLPPFVSDDERRFCDLFGLFTGTRDIRPSALTPEHERILVDLVERAGDESTKLVAADLLAAQYVRAGAGSDAIKVLDKIDQSKIVEWDQSILYTNQRLSVAYTSLDRAQALQPSTWGFDQALGRLDLTHLANLTGIGGRFNSGKLEVDVVAGVRIPDDGYMDGPLGFYVTNWLLLRWIAGLPDSERRDAALEHLNILKNFAKRPSLGRQVWNFAYIAGLQLHRFGKSNDNANGDFELRDVFFRVCTGQVEGFELIGDQSSRLSRPSPDDPVPICMAILLRSDPAFRNSPWVASVASAAHLADLSAAIRSISVRRAADQFRAAMGVEIGARGARERYFGDDGTLSIYSDHPSIIRSELFSSRSEFGR